MSIDERSRRIVQPHLLPGETLAWAGPAAVPPRLARLALLVGAATFLVIVVLGTMAAASFFWGFVTAGIWFGAPMGLAVFNWPAQVDRSHNKPTHYAITDRRILFFSTPEMETLPVAAYSPQDIQCVRRQDRPDGTSDLLIRQADGPGRGTVGRDGIAVPFQVPMPEVALRGVAEGGAVEALIAALRSGALAALAVAAVVAPAPAPRTPVAPRPGPDGRGTGARAQHACRWVSEGPRLRAGHCALRRCRSGGPASGDPGLRAREPLPVLSGHAPDRASHHRMPGGAGGSRLPARAGPVVGAGIAPA